MMPILAVQTVVSFDDIPVATSISLLFQQLGPAIFIAAAQAVLLNRLLPQLLAIIPDLTEIQIVEAGATGLKTLVNESQLPILLGAYATSLDAVFIVAAALAAVAAIFGLGIEWKSVKKQNEPLDIEDS
jgi:hypothetical protein